MSAPGLRHLRLEGLPLTTDFLSSLLPRDPKQERIQHESYGLFPGETVEEAIAASWDRLRKAYSRFLEARARNPHTDGWRYWMSPLMQELGHTPLEASPALAVDGKPYPIAYLGLIPVHAVGYGEKLETIVNLQGHRSSPHGLVQEYLNRQDSYRWGLVTNGQSLRLLHKNAQMTRSVLLEYDLEGIFDGGDSGTFRLLWLTLHRSRFEGTSGEAPLERWAKTSGEGGSRARDLLRDGVQLTIERLGQGLLSHPKNAGLREQLRNDLSGLELYRACLRLIYQLVFLFVLEDRDLLHPENTDPALKKRYSHYSSRRLRKLALELSGSVTHSDGYEGLKVLLRGAYRGLPHLGLPALGSDLFNPEGNLLLELSLSNAALYDALRALCLLENKDKKKTLVNFAGLDSEELGSIYESLLELHPQINTATQTFTLSSAAGNERKTTGSYYTPSGLIELLLESALDPVIEGARRSSDPIAALKALKVVDPACGSGHFLIAAARRIGLALAQETHGVEQPAPEQLREAVRETVSHCIYGVDLNPMAVELCKVALWLESVNPGKPLSFLDHRIRGGNSLLGTHPDLMASSEILKGTKVSKYITHPDRPVTVVGIPEDAYAPLEGDDKLETTRLKKQNKLERQIKARSAEGEQALFGTGDDDQQALAQRSRTLDALSDDQFEAQERKRQALDDLKTSEAYQRQKLKADAWCAAFVWVKVSHAPPPPTTATLDALERPEHTATRQGVQALAEQYRFFHWHLEYPEVSAAGGFDCVLGNPPWEQLQLDPQEFFAVLRPDIAGAKNMTARNKMIAKLKDEFPSLHKMHENALREMEGIQHFIHASGRFPLTSFGRLNTSSLFCEQALNLVKYYGRLGVISPRGIVTDDTNKFYFQHITEKNLLVEVLDFDNKMGVFDSIHRDTQFCLLTIKGSSLNDGEKAEYVFSAFEVSDVKAPNKRFNLTPEDIKLINPNTRTCPTFRSSIDARIVKYIYENVPIFVNDDTKENFWGVKFMLMFMMNTASDIFRTKEYLNKQNYTYDGNYHKNGNSIFLPLYEAKLIYQYDHRFASFVENEDLRDLTIEEKFDPFMSVRPRYWVNETEVEKRLERLEKNGDLKWSWLNSWLLGFRDVTNSTNERTAIFSIVPRTAVGNNCPIIFPDDSLVLLSYVLVSNGCSFIFDYTSRFGVGGRHLNFHILKQLPVLPPSSYSPIQLEFIRARVLELTYTAWDLQGFAQDCGYYGPPFEWNEERRFVLRAELDALYFHLYAIPRDDVDYILETFKVVRRKDEAKHGNYRTKLEILDLYDQMERLGLRLEEFSSRLGEVGVGRVVEAVSADAPALPKRSEFNPVFDEAVLEGIKEHPELASLDVQRSVFYGPQFRSEPKTVAEWLEVFKVVL